MGVGVGGFEFDVESRRIGRRRGSRVWVRLRDRILEETLGIYK